MNALDVLYYSLAISVLALTGGILYLLYHLVQTIKQMQEIMKDVNSVTGDLEAMKEGLKNGVVGKFVAFSQLFSQKRKPQN